VRPQRIHIVDRSTIGRHETGVEHVALVIPAHADVEQQASYRTPVILEVRSDLVVVRLHERIARSEPELERSRKVVRLSAVAGIGCLRVVKLRKVVITLVYIVVVVVEAESTLEDMLSR